MTQFNMAEVEGKQICSAALIFLILVATSGGSVFQGSPLKNNVLKFDMKEVIEAQDGETVLNQRSNSRAKRDVPESSECRDQEQNFLNSAAQTEGFLNNVRPSFLSLSPLNA